MANKKNAGKKNHNMKQENSNKAEHKNDKANNNNEGSENIEEQKQTEEEVSNENIRAEEIKTNEKKLQQEIEEANDKFLRLYSEFDNYRKRTNKERQELRKYAAEDIIVSLLPVLDDFDRAIQSLQESKENDEAYKGFELIHSKLKKILKQKGLEDMDSVEKEFDTDYHEAVSYIPAPKEELKGKIVDVTQKGYLLNGKVIRFAKVVIGN